MAQQTRPADEVLGADTGSSDNSGELLRRALGERNVISLEPRKGFGAAVGAVIAQQRRQRSALSSRQGTSNVAVLDPEPDGSNEWIWLLQDDAEPAPDALQLLLEATERSATATVVGCKQLDWDNRRRLVDVGLSANKWFDRFTMVGIDEQDQQQHDGNADMFAVNTAGMLIRRDVFAKLGGFDPALHGPGDDLDFCARVRLLGDRVLVVPEARMFHVAHRPDALGDTAATRKAAVFLRLKHAPLWAVPFVALGTFFAAIYWLGAGFVLKAPGHALRIFAATCAGLFRVVQLARSRKALAAARTMPRSVHKRVLVDHRTTRHQLRTLRETLTPDDDRNDEATPTPALLEPTGDAHQRGVTPMAVIKTAPIVSALGMFLLLAIFSLIVMGRFIGAPALTGGALLPVSAQLATVWSHASDWWVSLGSGLPGRGEPFNFVLAALASLGGDGSRSVLWLVLLAVPLAAFSAWLAAGAFTRQRWIRIVAGLVWAGAPALLIALGQGRLGALVSHLLIPLVVLGLVRAVGGGLSRQRPGDPAQGSAKVGRPGVDGNPSWTAAAAAGLALAAVTAAAPSLFLAAVVAVMAAVIVLRRRARTIWWALVPSLALMAPFAWSAMNNPRALLADPGVPLASSAAPVWQQLLGFPEALAAVDSQLGLGPGLAAPWLTWLAVGIIGLPVVATAVVALVLPLRRAAMVRAMWLLALLGLAVAYGSKFLVVAFDGGALVTPFSGPAVSLTIFALLAAAVLGFDAVYRRAYVEDRTPAEGLPPARHRSAKTTAVVLSVTLLAAPVLSLGLWSAQQFTGHESALTGTFAVQGVTAGTIPATAADRGTGPEGSRTLVLSLTEGGVQANLMQGAGTTLDAMNTIATAAPLGTDLLRPAVAEADPATLALQDTVAVIMSKSGIDPRKGLVDLGVGFVVLRQGDTASELLASELEAVPGLDTVGPTDSGWLWRVKPTYAGEGAGDVVNRVRITDAKGAALAPVASSGQQVSTDIAAGDSGRRVVLAERADSGWEAWYNGKPLTAVEHEWAQAFELPAEAGKLDIRYVQPLHVWFALGQVLLLGLTLLLALPVRARRGRTGAYRDEISLQRVGRGA